MTSNTNNNGNIWPLLIGIFIFATILQMLFGGSSSATRTSSDYTPAMSGVDRNSFEHRYAKERVKMEGYSDREATQAADAIIKFHNAQQNR